MIKTLNISNFKCIDKTQIAIKPITILCGPNSSGKSSLSQSLLLLKQSAEAIGGIHTLSPRGNVVDLGSYPDLIRNHEHDSILNYKITLDTNSFYLRRDYSLARRRHLKSKTFRQRRIDQSDRGELIIDLDYKYMPVEEKIILDRLSIKEGDAFIIESRKNKTGTYRFVYGLPTVEKLRWSNPNLASLTDFLSPRMPREMLMERSLSAFKSEMLYDLRSAILSDLNLLISESISLHYLGPFRQTPTRFYMTGGAMPSDIGYKGESSVDYLNYMKMSNQEGIISFTRRWLERLEYSSHFDVTTIKSFIKSVTLKNKITNIESTLIDVGFGISQVLPVIIAVYRHSYGIHIFEQPELHLHPKSQADIADLFIENSDDDVAYIIETHSEHFLNRFRRRIAEGTLNPNNIIIYYICHDKNGYHINEINIANNGSFINFPPHFFDESYQESKVIMESSIKKRRKLKYGSDS